MAGFFDLRRLTTGAQRLCDLNETRRAGRGGKLTTLNWLAEGQPHRNRRCALRQLTRPRQLAQAIRGEIQDLGAVAFLWPVVEESLEVLMDPTIRALAAQQNDRSSYPYKP